MARRIINTGNVANDNTGDSLRVAFNKANDNFAELFTFLNSNIGDISSNGTLLIAGTLTSTGNTYVRTNGFYLQDSNDFSKQARFNIADYPNGTISTLTLPSGTTSLLSPESVATLSNKIIDGTVNTLRNIPLGNANVAGTLAVTHGGTGVSTAPDVGQLLVGTGTGFKLAQLTPGEGITIDNSNPGAITISGSQALNATAIQDIVQQMFSENESEGISESFDPTNRKINLFANDFNVILEGDVTGSNVVHSLTDVRITTTAPGLLKGVTTSYNGYPTGGTQSVKQLNFTGPVQLTQSGDVTTIAVSTQLTTKDVRDIIGNTVTSSISESNIGNTYTDSGIIVLYDQENNALRVSPRDFNVNLTGVITGTGTSHRLQDITINTATTSLITGLTGYANGVPTGTAQSIKGINFVGNLLVAQTGSNLTVTLPNQLQSSNVRDIIGSTIQAGYMDANSGIYTDSGIVTTYVEENNAVYLAPRDFYVNITGDVVGSAQVTHLRDTTINVTSPDLIRGLTTQKSGVLTGGSQSVGILNFTGCVDVSQSGNITTINVPTPLSSGNVQDIIGSTIQGTIRDSQTNTFTNSGIIVLYDDVNKALSVAPRDFKITLSGDVSGTATVSRLGNTTIQTTTSAIKGITVKNDNTLAGYSGNIKSLNFIGASSITVDNAGQANVTIPGLNASQVAPIVGSMFNGTQYGVNATYNSNNKNIDFSLKPIKINLAGAINGTGNITFNGGANDGVVTINTTGGSAGSGLVVADEYNVTGAVNEINFVGGGVTTAISIDGQVATVYVPNSPAAENFILATAGSENVQNARRFAAGTGIAITDEGPGGRYIVSAVSDALLAKTQYYAGNVAIGQELGLDVRGSQDMVVQAIDDAVNKKVIYTVYSLEDGWYRQPAYDCGAVTDKYGGSLDMGDFSTKIINYAADLGTL